MEKKVRPKRLPRIASMFLHRMKRYEEDFFWGGDMEEEYNNKVRSQGAGKAYRWLWKQVLGSIPSYFKASLLGSLSMFRNYVMTTFRNINRHKGHSFINITGLAFGLSFFLLISLHIQFELSFDRYHEKADRIYRIARELPKGHTHGGKTQAGSMIPAIGPALVQDYPEVVSAVRLMRRRNILLSYNQANYLESEVFYAEPEIFGIFTLPLIRGDAGVALSDPHSIVLSQKMAEKYFGHEDPLGKIIQYRESQELKVTGVLADMPKNSHFVMDFIIPFKTLVASLDWDLNSWTSNFCHTYILLAQGADPAVLEEKFPALYRNYAPPEAKPGALRYCQPFLQSLTRIHLHSDLDGELGSNNTMSNIFIFATIAFLILLLACVNYMNLATARSTQRIREVGIRKVVGAYRTHLIKQFLGESLVFTLIAFCLSLAIVQLILPVFNAFLETRLDFSSLSGSRFFLWMLVVVMTTGFLAGSYPALLISSFRPVAILKSKQIGDTGYGKLRNALVVFQFTVSAVLIISALVVRNQLHFIRNMDVGFNKDQIVVIRLHDDNLRNFEAVKAEMKANPNILEVSISDALPNNIQSQSGPQWPGMPEDLDYFDIYVAAVDEGYIATFGLKLESGRNFSREFPADKKGAFIFNQALVDALGWEAPLGREFIYWRGEVGCVVGVVQDFNFHSLHKNIEPMYFFYHEEPWNRAFISVKIQGGAFPETIDYLSSTLKRFSPNYPMDFSFFDDIFDRAYRKEKRLGTVFNIFSLLAIGIACLGLLGLASYSAEQRTKEIGIRKILGASLSGIFVLLSKDYLKWVLWSNLIAWPVGYLVMHSWLQNFAYKAPLDPWIFIISAATALSVAFLTIIAQTFRASLANPIESLRYE